MNLHVPLLLTLVFISGLGKGQWTTFDRYNTTGLTASTVTSIISGSEDEIWLGSNKGVFRYKYSTETWTNFEGNPSAPGYVNAIFKDHQQKVWACTNDGVRIISTNQILTLTTQNSGLTSNIVRSGVQQSPDYIWFATYGGGICRLNVNDSSWITFDEEDGLPGDYYYSAFKDVNGNLWFGSSNHGVVRFDGVSWTNYTTSDGLAGNTALYITADSENRLLVAGDNGVSIFDGSIWQQITSDDGLTGDIAYSVVEDINGRLLIGTDNGIQVFDEQLTETINSANGLSEDRVYALFADVENHLWIGHSQNGISHFNGIGWIHFGSGTGMPEENIIDICEDRNHRMWFLSGGGLCRFDGHNWTKYLPDPIHFPNFPPTLYCMDADDQGNLWIGHAKGISKFDGNNWTLFNKSNGLADDPVFDLFIDSHNRIWARHPFAQTSLLEGSEWKRIYPPEISPWNFKAPIFEDSEGNIWFTKSTFPGSIMKYDGNSWTVYTATDFSTGTSAEVYSIYENANGEVSFLAAIRNPDGYLGEEKNMTFSYDGQEFVNMEILPVQSSLQTEALYTTFDALYLCSRKGNPGIHDTLVSVLKDGDWSFYSTSDGISTGLPTLFFEDSYHNVWLSTSKGLSRDSRFSVDINEIPVPQENKLVNYPNPFREQTHISFELQTASEIKVTLFSASGMLVNEESYGKFPPGTQTITFDGSLLPDGIYYYRLNTSIQNYTGKFCLIR